MSLKKKLFRKASLICSTSVLSLSLALSGPLSAQDMATDSMSDLFEGIDMQDQEVVEDDLFDDFMLDEIEEEEVADPSDEEGLDESSDEESEEDPAAEISLEELGIGSSEGSDTAASDTSSAPVGSAPSILEGLGERSGQPTGLDLPLSSGNFDPDRLETGEGMDHEVDPDGDQLTEAVTQILREGGLLQRQEEIGQSLLLMDRQSRFVNSVNQLLNLLGPDAEIEVAPGVFQRFEDTPIGRQALIARLNQEREVIAAQIALDQAQFNQIRQTESFEQEIRDLVDAGLDDRIEQEREQLLGRAMSEADRIQSEAVQTAQMRIEEAERVASQSIEDAQIEAAQIRAEADAYRDELTAELEELRAQEREKLIALDARERELEEREALIAALPIPEFSDIVEFTVNEIYGSGGSYEAIIQRAGQLVRVRSGDRLPDGPQITRIGRDFVEFEYLGERRRLTL